MLVGQNEMGLLNQILSSILKHKENSNMPFLAFYVDYEECKTNILKNGIPLSPDGCIHLFGNLSCAFTKRDMLEQTGKKGVIFKVDISNYISEFDPSGEEISKLVIKTYKAIEKSDEGEDSNKYCHGYIIKEVVPPSSILDTEDYI